MGQRTAEAGRRRPWFGVSQGLEGDHSQSAMRGNPEEGFHPKEQYRSALPSRSDASPGNSALASSVRWMAAPQEAAAAGRHGRDSASHAQAARYHVLWMAHQMGALTANFIRLTLVDL